MFPITVVFQHDTENNLASTVGQEKVLKWWYIDRAEASVKFSKKKH